MPILRWKRNTVINEKWTRFAFRDDVTPERVRDIKEWYHGCSPKGDMMVHVCSYSQVFGYATVAFSDEHDAAMYKLMFGAGKKVITTKRGCK